MNPTFVKLAPLQFVTVTQLDTDGSHHGDPNYVPTKTLIDTRDNNTYTVSKLADGKCWMTQNLRIVGKPLPQPIPTSPLIISFRLPRSTALDITIPQMPTSITTAVSIPGIPLILPVPAPDLFINGHNAAASICPKGWRLPTGGSSGEFQTLYNNYNSYSALISNPVNLTPSGYVNLSSRYNPVPSALLVLYGILGRQRPQSVPECL